MLTEKQKKALKLFDKKLDGRLRTHLNSCVHCGLCGEVCHYYLATKDERYLPVRKVEQIAQLYRHYYTLSGKLFPKWFGSKELNEDTTKEMLDILFGGCTMCGRCSIHCTIGVDVPFLVRTGRSLLVELSRVSPGLQSTIDTALKTGNNMGIPREELIETLEWLEEDLQMEVDDDEASIPLDNENVNILYTLNPREPKFFPLSISAIAAIFYAAKENWTISTHSYDVTNYAYYSGDDIGSEDITKRLYDETIKLKANKLVLAECGHGFRAMRWEGANWIKEKYPFETISIIEVMADYIRSGRIKVDPSKNQKPVTLHDPCNLVRSGGIIEEQRYILNKSVETFVEMTPNRENNYCCGGGGGQLAMSEYSERRVLAGKIKAEQIRKTGAKIVATPCHNCIDQLMELNKEYNLNVEIKTVGEIVAEALIIEK